MISTAFNYCETCTIADNDICEPYTGGCMDSAACNYNEVANVSYVPISFADAALGGELEVPTLDGRVKLKIPSETQTGKLFRLRGKGVKPVRGGGTGDLLCRSVVETPINLTKRQREILEELKISLGEGGKKQSPRQTNWFEGVKRFFDDMTT